MEVTFSDCGLELANKVGSKQEVLLGLFRDRIMDGKIEQFLQEKGQKFDRITLN